MSNYIEYGDRVAFHPGYYIKELVDDSGLTQEDFAKRLDTTPKNLSVIISGQQSLSIEMATKLSRMLGTSIDYWLNIQKAYDALQGEFNSNEELLKERELFKSLDYTYFKNHFKLPDLPRQIDKQIIQVRKFLRVASLMVLGRRDMTVSFRSADYNLSSKNIIRANTMVQIAINHALQIDAPKFDKNKFNEVVNYALTLTKDHEHFYGLLKDACYAAGVIFVILPNLPGSKINGATKKVGNNVMLMVNDRQLSSDIFWFTLLHEMGHIINGDYGMSFEEETEDAADHFAIEKLIPSSLYDEFVKQNRFTPYYVNKFANSINRDPSIVLGRLQKDKIISYGDPRFNDMKRNYKVHIEIKG